MIKVFPSSLTSLYIDWELEGDAFTVYRSTAPHSSFQKIIENYPYPFFEDKDVSLYDENIRYYYFVEGYDLNGNKVSSTEPQTWLYTQKDNVAQKVIYESKVVLKAMKNPPVYFLIKKRVGSRCPDCWNPITQKSRFANCSTCNGTGIVGGYHDPIPVLISRDISQLRSTSGEVDADKVSLTPIRAWISNYPLIYPEDVMVTTLNERYKVQNVALRTKSQYIIRQILDLVPLEKGHPAFKMPVDRTVTIG